MKTRSRLLASTLLVLGLTLGGCSAKDSDTGAAEKSPATESAPVSQAAKTPSDSKEMPVTEVQIRIGADGVLAKSPDLNVAALRSGHKNFTVVNNGTSYQIELTTEEVADLLDGSTVLAATTGGAEGTETIRLSLGEVGKTTASDTGAGW